MTTSDPNNLRKNLLELLFNPLAQLPDDNPEREITPEINASTAIWLQRERNSLAISILEKKLNIDPNHIIPALQDEAYQRGKLDVLTHLIGLARLTSG